ncbi:MAG TPA: methylmalonyl-CoA mutase family protein [Myxococcota bacterium]|nr:methylmalonyl-CoA mutase family protein [Myxococcota bacterium]
MKLKHHVRFITAASLFDGHDAAIQIMRRILQSEGAEVIHLGHNRSAWSVVKAAIEEDAQGIAVSSYQGGHVEYFTYMLGLLKEHDASSIQIFGGGGGVIVKSEIELLESRGIKKIFSPDDGHQMGLTGMIQHMLAACDVDPLPAINDLMWNELSAREIGQIITTIELGAEAERYPTHKKLRDQWMREIKTKAPSMKKAPVIGITGTGGAGKSSLIDDVLLRFLFVYPKKRVAVLSVDPTRIKTGGALLGDRIRMNCADDSRIYMRSMATRAANLSVSQTAKDVLDFLAFSDFDLVIFETAGIGQSDQSVKEFCDFPIYVMTPEYGAASQLEKIGMLDCARLVVINKFDRSGSLDALRDVQKAYQRNHQLFDRSPSEMPVIGTSAHIYGDLGTNRFFNRLMDEVKQHASDPRTWDFENLPEGEAANNHLIPKKRARYLSEIADSIREHRKHIERQGELADRVDALDRAMKEIAPEPDKEAIISPLAAIKTALSSRLDQELKDQVERLLENMHELRQPESVYHVRGKAISVENFYQSLSHTPIPKVMPPDFLGRGDLVRFAGLENLPGHFPFTAGVFPFKRNTEDPTRMFAGEGSPERTNKRFHYLSKGHPATRLSTAFDSVTLYGENPDLRPDIYGKVGNAGVSVCSLDDAKRLYSGFDLTADSTSVSMTINGPAPTLLAFFFNAAIDFAVEKELKKSGNWPKTKERIDAWFRERNWSKPVYRAEELPEGHDGTGLGFLGLPASEIVPKDFYDNVRAHVLENVRGTVQADILKEDQAQNTCIFSTEFSLRMMGDCQEYFIKNNVNNFYSVSVSGYHIAEAGANPVSQLAFTLANGFTLLEYYRARGMNVDDFAKNFSFFFSNGVDPEYAVIGRVARRIWAIALKKVYGANERSQKLKYHIQTSGRSLHAQEMAFNDIRTTLQALYAIADNCNSLHTNAFDEAITTPTESSVRRAVAIQMIINHELGLTKNENPWQGSYFLEYLTDKVEQAVLRVFDGLDARGGVLGAMETMYQRHTIQEESLYYEHKKQTGALPIIGVNTFFDAKHPDAEHPSELMRSTEQEKQFQVEEVNELKGRFVKERRAAFARLKEAVLCQENTFGPLMEAAKYSTIGEISHAFFAVGGAYRRAM